MEVFTAIVAFIIILIILVIAHEFAHFITAKSKGVKVHEFGIGFPPRIWGIKRGETLYSINALPLGGFVKLSGEEDPQAERSLASKGYGTRLLVLSSGSLMNLILPLFIAALAFIIPHNNYYPTRTITEVVPDSPAQLAGLQVGDTILAINSEVMDQYSQIQKAIRSNPEVEISLKIQRADGSESTLMVTPRLDTQTGYGLIGIRPGEEVIRESLPIWEAFPRGAAFCWNMLVGYKDAVGQAFAGAESMRLIGIVGMTEVTGKAAQQGFSTLLLFAAFISINLGIINLLPLPALDGGRIFFVFLEMLRGGRRISPRVEGLIHGIGFLLLIGLMLLLVYSDVAQLITTGSVLGP
ncbi:MAG TPA: RIP metalloprotease RseP [Dehalococcoidales bacterium]|nr:RIP metalloprotease RseP [Dehalococcoidales bacterium]